MFAEDNMLGVASVDLSVGQLEVFVSLEQI